MTEQAAGAGHMPDTAQRLMAHAAANLQLLAVLEVLKSPGAEDAEHLMDAAGETQLLAALAAGVERMSPLDPDGSVRDRLRACIARAGDLHHALTQRARPTRGLTGVPARLSIGLGRLMQACEQLHAAIVRHDRVFEQPGASDAAQA